MGLLRGAGPRGLAGVAESRDLRHSVLVRPMLAISRIDCQGLCEICGGNRNLGECPGHEALDPRFAVLAELLPDLPDSD